jgi:hypothetical protein
MGGGRSCAGERGRTRRGLDLGERCEELRREGEAGSAGVPLKACEKLAWCWWPFSRGCEERLLAVLCDQRFTFPVPSRKIPMPSAAALERLRWARGGGVARAGAVPVEEGVWFSLSEAARWTVTTEDEEMDLSRRCAREVD